MENTRAARPHFPPTARVRMAAPRFTACLGGWRQPRWRGNRLWLLALALTIGMGVVVARAEAPLEYAVKGAFLFKFGTFVEWPANTFPEGDAPFAIGILGDDPFGGELDRLAQNRMVQGRPVVVRHFKRADQIRNVQVLFVDAGVRESKQSIDMGLRGASVLTVADKTDRYKGVIAFVLEENRVRFEIDAEEAERSGLKISSKLLSLAKPANRNEH